MAACSMMKQQALSDRTTLVNVAVMPDALLRPIPTFKHGVDDAASAAAPCWL